MSKHSTNPKDRIGRTKPPLHLIPASAAILESLALGDGERKYGAFNWRRKTVAATVYVGAILRHVASWFDGEELARDSKVHHLAHARACFAILIDAMVNGKLVDDRPIPGKAAELIAKYTAHALKKKRRKPRRKSK